MRLAVIQYGGSCHDYEASVFTATEARSDAITTQHPREVGLTAVSTSSRE
jgi:hypothetical protein